MGTHLDGSTELGERVGLGLLAVGRGSGLLAGAARVGLGLLAKLEGERGLSLVGLHVLLLAVDGRGGGLSGLGGSSGGAGHLGGKRRRGLDGGDDGSLLGDRGGVLGGGSRRSLLGLGLLAERQTTEQAVKRSVSCAIRLEF